MTLRHRQTDRHIRRSLTFFIYIYMYTHSMRNYYDRGKFYLEILTGLYVFRIPGWKNATFGMMSVRACLHLCALLWCMIDWAIFIRIRYLTVYPSKVRFQNEYSWLENMSLHRGLHIEKTIFSKTVLKFLLNSGNFWRQSILIKLHT
jgi:hypothetical protein